MTNSIANAVKTFRMVYTSMAITQLVVGFAAWYLTRNPASVDYDLAITLQKVAIFFVPGAMAVGYFLFKTQVAKIDKSMPLVSKIAKYHQLILVRGAMIEAAFLTCCVFAFITSVELFLYILPVVFFVFLLMRPTRGGMIDDMQLSQTESNQLE